MKMSLGIQHDIDCRFCCILNLNEYWLISYCFNNCTISLTMNTGLSGNVSQAVDVAYYKIRFHLFIFYFFYFAILQPKCNKCKCFHCQVA